ncbi:MAG: CerR family C-terminal domain-containing protein [Silicimonas sp.]|nr:CerR family C-terminal domain-containing protein [Silicimonas sp.]
MNDSGTNSDTRAGLIEAGLELFGHKGFDGTSTRELAARAGTNVASISYHFGSKAGLREACALAVTDRMSRALDGALATPDTEEAALGLIEKLVRALVDLIVGSPEAANMVAFMLREITEPGDVAEMVYRSFVEPRHKALCGLWAMATGRSPDDAEVKLAVFALVGQVLYFRIASPFVIRRLSWGEIGQDETRQIADLVIDNLRNSMERQKK